MEDLTLCRCVRCAATNLELDPTDARVRCAACGIAYDVIDGIPYLLSLERRDFVSLIEIAGEFDRPAYDTSQAKPLDDTWPRLLREYDSVADKAAFAAQCSPGIRGSLAYRHEEWREIMILTRDIDLSGRHVLVLGAGLGFDVNLLVHRGAIVTAMDLNPQTNAYGKRSTPSARWIGGLGRNLPFCDETFDHVFINAALHHVLDVSKTITEMLRVTKPGGSVVTTSDSFVPDTLTDQEDARFWNDHVAVLRGINENRHRLGVYFDPIVERQAKLQIELWTSRAYGLWDQDKGDYTNLLEPTRWDFEEGNTRLRACSGGGIFMRLTKNDAMAEEFAPAGDPLIRPSELVPLIGDKANAMAVLARLAPPEHLPPKFPGAAGNTKVQVLNGWRWREAGEVGREAYLCGRWLLRRSASHDWLEVDAMAPDDVPGAVSLQLVVDGVHGEATRTPRGQLATLRRDISAIPTTRPFAVEVRLTGHDADLAEQPMAHGLFRVRRLEMGPPTLLEWLGAATGLKRKH